MHGLLFKSLKDYVIQNHGTDAWGDICDAANVDEHVYLTIDTYEDKKLFRLFNATADYSDCPVPTLLESYGAFTANTLLTTYQSSIDDDWDALDLLANIDDYVHDVLRVQETDAEPPKLNCRRETPTKVTVEYHSDRQLCFMAKGIIQGIGTHYDAPVSLTENACMHAGADYCELVVMR